MKDDEVRWYCVGCSAPLILKANCVVEDEAKLLCYKCQLPRIIFVGIHNKPNMKPLDSRTRTGKMIDKICLLLNKKGFMNNVVRSNLFPLDQFPQGRKRETDIQWVNNWSERIGVKESDTVVTLGQTVNDIFRWAKFKSIKVGHPSGVWSNEEKELYVKRVASLIRLSIISTKRPLKG